MVKLKKTNKEDQQVSPKRRSDSGEKDLPDMTSSEKKTFLQNDIIERMIRIEQAVSGEFGKSQTPQETNFYKELSKEEKMAFNKYLNNKKKKSFWKLFALILPLFIFGIMKFGFTGNVIREATGAEPYWWGWVALGIFIVFGTFMWASYLLKKFMEKRMDHHEKDLVRRLRGGKK